MSHELENMFSVKETPWHGLGVIVREAPTAEEAIKLGGLDWKVLQKPVFLGENGIGTPIESHQAIVRETDQKVFTVIGKQYTPLQNKDAFSFFNPFVEKGLASFETAGSLRGGKVVWILAKLNKAPIEVGKGDLVNKFLLLSNSHDGTMAVRVGFTPIRVVCANTLAMSHANRRSQLIRVLHTKSILSNLEKIQNIVNAADAKFEATAEQYRALTRVEVNQKDIKKFVEIVFEFPTIEFDLNSMLKQKVLLSITRLFETGRGSELASAKGTLWGLYNATTEYLSYERGKTQDTRINHLWFGEGVRQNEKALQTALEMASA